MLEDNLQESVIYFYIVGLENQTQIVSLGDSHLYLQNYLTGPLLVLPLSFLFYIKLFGLCGVISCSEVWQLVFYLSVNAPLLFIT